MQHPTFFEASSCEAHNGIEKEASIRNRLPKSYSFVLSSFLDGTSSTYLEELEERYRADPSSVDKTWASFFRSLGEIPDQGPCSVIPPSLTLLLPPVGLPHGCRRDCRMP